MSKGFAKGVAEDVNTIVGRTWIAAFQNKTVLFIERVESGANCADEQTRNAWTYVRALKRWKIHPGSMVDK